MASLFGRNDYPDDYASAARTSRANRRRLAVFATVFLLVAIVGLVYVYSRPAIYQSTVRLNFVPASTPRTDARPGDTRFTLRDEVEFLTSRTLLARVADRMKTTGGAAFEALTDGASSDPTAVLQSMISARQVEGTNIVVLTARGGRADVLAPLLDRLVSAYLGSLAERYSDASAGTLADAADEAKKLEASAAAKRREADAFRARYNIVSLERDDNQVLSEVRATTAALNAANDKVVAAEARLASVQDAQAAGKAVTRARDNPTLAALEQQAIAIRAELREVGRTFTPQYMQIDPRIRSLRERLGEIEQQIVVQGKASQQAALQEANEELATARSAATRLRQQLTANQQSVQAFSSRFAEYRAMQDEVARIEQLRQKAVERQTALAAEEGARMPKVEAVEAAAVPTSPASPAYGRDAVLAVLAALLAGLLTMGLVELFNRPPPRPATVVVQQSWTPTSRDPRGAAAIGVDRRRDLLEQAPARPAVLAAPSVLPRELMPDESRALYDAAGADLRAAIVLLLAGLTSAEIVGLRPVDLDREANVVRAGADGRRPSSASRRAVRDDRRCCPRGAAPR